MKPARSLSALIMMCAVAVTAVSCSSASDEDSGSAVQGTGSCKIRSSANAAANKSFRRAGSVNSFVH